MPSEAERMRILLDLLNLKHFHGIWYDDQRRMITVRSNLLQPPQYLSWERAAEIIDLARQSEIPGRKPAKAEKSAARIPASSVGGK